MGLFSFADRERGALSGAGLYAVGQGWEAALQLLVVPFVTRAMSVEEFGQFALLYVAIPVLLLSVELGTSLAVVRWLASADEADRGRIVSSYFWPRFALGGAIAVGILLLAPLVPVERLLGEESRAALPFVVLTFVTAILQDGVVEGLRGQERHRESALSMPIRSTARAAALLTLVVAYDGGLPGLFAALAIGNVAGLAYGAARLGRQLLHRPDLALFGELVRFGLPTATMFLVRIALDLDRYLVRALTSVSMAGLYQLASVPANGVEMVNRVGAFPIEPYVYGADPAERARALVRATRIFFLGSGAAAVTLALFAPEILRLLAPEEYAGALVATSPLLFAVACSGAIRIVGLGAGVAHRPRAWAIASVAELVVALGLILLVAPSWGIAGVAGMRFVGGLVGLSVCYGVALTAWPVRLPVPRGIAFFVVGAAVAAVAHGTFGGDAWPLAQRALAWPVVLGLGALLIATFRLPEAPADDAP